jgi:hypothetical protein
MENRRERARRCREVHAAPATGRASGAVTRNENANPNALSGRESPMRMREDPNVRKSHASILRHDAPGAAAACTAAAGSEEAADLDVTPWLRRLGFRSDEARRAAAWCSALPDSTLEQRVKAALSFLRPGGVRYTRTAAAAPTG